jgi:sugar O-acyltransferase (sialic acid O-acetyltransferase NeuD family)
MTGLVLWGAGGHGSVVLDCAVASRAFDPICFVDDGWEHERSFHGRELLGTSSKLERARKLGYSTFLIAIGSNATRRSCFGRALGYGLEPAVVIHPGATVSTSAVIGGGTVIMPGAVVNAGARIGRNCIINTAAVVEHGCLIEDDVHISPRAALGGGAAVHRLGHVGIGAILLPGADVGEGAVIGAGAVVLNRVPAGVTVVGVPARLLDRRRGLKHHA